MTNKKAIAILRDLWRTKHSTYSDKEIRCAIDVAILALTQIEILNRVSKEVDKAMLYGISEEAENE